MAWYVTQLQSYRVGLRGLMSEGWWLSDTCLFLSSYAGPVRFEMGGGKSRSLSAHSIILCLCFDVGPICHARLEGRYEVVVAVRRPDRLRLRKAYTKGASTNWVARTSRLAVPTEQRASSFW